MPNNIDDYIHRIGRTGRCGNKGTAISFINDNNRPIIKDLYNLLKKHKQETPEWFEDLFKKYQYEKNGKYFKNHFNFIVNVFFHFIFKSKFSIFKILKIFRQL